MGLEFRAVMLGSVARGWVVWLWMGKGVLGVDEGAVGG